MGRSERVSDVEFIEAMQASPDPFVTSKELADILGYSRDGARRRLQSLEESGYVRSRSVGANAKVWWLTTQGEDELR
jgi:predicted ArsR family transcriptional regulator